MSKRIHSETHDTQKDENTPATTASKMLENQLRRFKNFLESRPKTVYAFMVVSIVSSAIIAFTVMKPPKPSPNTTDPSVASLVSSGFGNLASTAAALGDLLELQAAVNGLLDKDSLTTTDSLMLDSALTRMHQIENQMKALNSTTHKKKTQDED